MKLNISRPISLIKKVNSWDHEIGAHGRQKNLNGGREC